MKEGYRITKAENGYFVEVFDEENNIRRVICATDDESIDDKDLVC